MPKPLASFPGPLHVSIGKAVFQILRQNGFSRSSLCISPSPPLLVSRARDVMMRHVRLATQSTPWVSPIFINLIAIFIPH